MRKTLLDTVITTIAAILLSAPVCASEGNTLLNPHSDSGDCSLCHIAPVEKLRGWFVFASTKKEMKTDLNQLCLQCHSVKPTHAGGFLGVGKGHATGKKPEVNRQNLPLANDGTVTCATTCHNVHLKSDDRRLKNNFLRISANDLCVSCHNM